MSVWLVRAGEHGERQDYALESNVAVIGWNDVPDLSKVSNKKELRDVLTRTYPGAPAARLRNWCGQLWAFVRRMQRDDLVVLPLKGQNAVAIGRVTGDYRYISQNPESTRHARPVEWIVQDMPRDRFDQDMLYSFGAFLTVCEVKRNNAEQRIRAILGGQSPPPPIRTKTEEEDAEEITDLTAQQNLEENAKTQIRTHIGQNFVGHKVADLVEAVLTAQGYKSTKSEPGPDGGVDIIAGRGPMGFDPPKLCVQVKSSTSPLDVTILRELKGVMRDFGAEQGLLVAWGGFKRTVIVEARRAFFEVRLWDADHLLDAILAQYDQFPEDLKADLPLKRIWTLVQEE